MGHTASCESNHVDILYPRILACHGVPLAHVKPHIRRFGSEVLEALGEEVVEDVAEGTAGGFGFGEELFAFEDGEA